MKVRFCRKLVLLLLLLSLPYLMAAYRYSPPEGFSISYMVNQAVLAFTGEVVDLEFVFRDNLYPQFTTDVTVKIEETIKGKPNAGENLVKFTISGGEGIHPETGEHLIAKVGNAPEFKKGEKVLMFLRKHKHLDKRPQPYGGLITGSWGKREIVANMVSTPYTIKDKRFYNGKWNEVDSVREILLPVDLTLQIAKAALKDAKAVRGIEARIRTFAQRAPLIPRTKPKPDKAFLDSIEAEITRILKKK